MLLLLKSFYNRLCKNPVRGLLSILSIGIGVMILALMFNLGSRVTEFFESPNDGIYSFLSGIYNGDESGEWREVINTDSFNQEQALAACRDIPKISAYAFMETRYSATIESGGYEYTIDGHSIAGSAIQEILDLQLVAGTFFTEADRGAAFCVVDEEFASIVFGSADAALNQDVTFHFFVFDETQMQEIVQKTPVTIIGVYESLSRRDRQKYGIGAMIISPGNSEFDVDQWGESGTIVKYDGSSQDKLEIELTEAILQQTGTDDIDLLVVKGSPQGDQMYVDDGEGFGVFSLFLSAIGMIILLVSCFGIFSMLMVSSLERVREVGLRRSLGATKLTIVLLFLSESLMYILGGAVVGGIGGAIISPVMMDMLSRAVGFFDMGYELNTSLAMVPYLKSVAAAVIAGMLFGLFPAISAARSVPVECLREE